MYVAADGRITALQQRPLPRPPVTANRRLISSFYLHYEKTQKPLGQVSFRIFSRFVNVTNQKQMSCKQA